jgi:hypothetical protein
VAPTVFVDVKSDARIFQEEIFGPVVAITPFDTDEEALKLANDTRYGLAAYVWTTNLKRAHNFAQAIESGMVWLNSNNVRDLRTPFGGVKASGLGREGGYRSIDPKDAAYITLGNYALVGSGLATLGQDDLDRISTGRKMGFDFEVQDASFQLYAETRPSDLADQLYLFAAKLDLPKWDVAPFTRAKAAAAIQYATFNTSPQGVLNRDLHALAPMIRGLLGRGLVVLAERVESREVLATAREIGCTLFQGYVYSRPETLDGRTVNVHQAAVFQIMALLK